MRHRLSLFVCVLALTSLLIPGSAALAARIIVTVDGIHSNQGTVYIGLYSNSAEFLNGGHCTAYRKVPASTAPITVAFDNLQPGTYAVGAYHDENGNGHLDTSPIGLPVEGYALSNGIRAVFAKPQFYQAAFTIGAGDKPVALHIRY